MAGLRRWRKRAASAVSNSNEDAEKGSQLRSRLDKILNIPQGVCLRFCLPVASLLTFLDILSTLPTERGAELRACKS
jgi:hypothetical protein